MSVTMPWYAKPWRRIRTRRRTLVAMVGYLLSGTLAIVSAVITSRGPAIRIMWLASAVILLYLGATLVATFLWQQRSRSR